MKTPFIFYFLLQVENNYETDLIFPIIEKASNLANVSYTLADESKKTNLKVSCNPRIVSFLGGTYFSNFVSLHLNFFLFR